MLKKAVIAHFGNQTSAADALGVTKQAVSRWKKYVPENIAYRVQDITRGKLKVDPAVYWDRPEQAESLGSERRISMG